MAVIMRIIGPEKQPISSEFLNRAAESFAVSFQEQVVDHEVKSLEVFIDGSRQHILQITDLLHVFLHPMLEIDGELRARFEESKIKLRE